MFDTFKTLSSLFLFILLTSIARAQQCPVNSILIKGQVEHAPRHASVRVQLFYAPDPHKRHTTGSGDAGQPGESTEAILDGTSFTIPVEFITSDRRSEMNFNPRCNHKPQSVVVTLEDADTSNSNSTNNNDGQIYDRITLDFPRDFQSDDSRHYTLRGELVLNGQP